MLINLIRDIDPNDEKYEALEILASSYGLFNMTVALMKIYDLLGSKNGQEILVQVDSANYRYVVATFLAMAVMNFASSRHEKYSIRVNNEAIINFSRTYSAEEHAKVASRYMAQANEIISKYEPK